MLSMLSYKYIKKYEYNFLEDNNIICLIHNYR